MSTPRVAVFGSFMMDLIAYAPRRPAAGETLQGTEFAMRPGGKGFNQACAARLAGAETAMIGLVGDDPFGDRFLAELADLGIDSSAVGREQATGTGVGLPVILPTGDNSIVIVPRANQVVGEMHAFVADEAIAAADVLLLQLEVPQAASARAAEIAKAAGTRVVLNPAPYQPVTDELMRFVDLVVPNEVEAAQWAGPSAPSAPAALADHLAHRLGCEVVLTAGGDGAFVVTRMADGAFAPARHVPALEAEAVDTVGAGDTFCGNTAARIAAGDSLSDAVRYANAAAGLYVARPGGATEAPTKAEVHWAMGPQTSVL